MNEYVIAFSSFYRAVYAQEKLQENRIRSTLKKLPPDLLRTCGYAVFLKTNSINSAIDILDKSQITSRGIYMIEYENGAIKYKQIAQCLKDRGLIPRSFFLREALKFYKANY